MAGLAVLGGILTLLVPTAKGALELRSTVIEPPHAGKTDANSMYRRILVALDATQADHHEYTLKRIKRLVHMAGGSVHILYIQHGHIVPGSIMAGAGLGIRTADDDVEPLDRQIVQSVVNDFSAAGIDAHGEMVSATEHDIARVILQRTTDLDIDLLVLENEYHTGAGQGLRASVAEQVIRNHPMLSILLARPPTRS